MKNSYPPCVLWMASLAKDELKSINGLTQKVTLDILLDLTKILKKKLPEPHLDADKEFFLSWTLENVTVSFDVDEDGKVEWKCLFSQRDKDEMGRFDGTKESKKRKKAISKIANILKNEK